MRAHARIAELPKIKRQLILNDTRISNLLLTAYDFRGNCDVLLLKKKNNSQLGLQQIWINFFTCFSYCLE